LALVVVAIGAEADHLIRDREYDSIGPVCRVDTNEGVVALTFDDGPDPAFTPQVLSLLKTQGDHATFFLIGKHADAYPEIVGDELGAGMEVADHTWSHPHLTDLSGAAATSEIARTRDLLVRDGATVSSFRPPFGEISPATLRAVRVTGLRTVLWSIPLDHYALGSDPSAATTELLRLITPGDIILAHDARAGRIDRGATIDTLRLLLPALAQQGYRVTTVSDLFARGTGVRAAPRPWFWQAGFSCPAPST
jgi:peptidoglycan/xylan/chitin deacetylase (PgdA/CDA1 family)